MRYGIVSLLLGIGSVALAAPTTRPYLVAHDKPLEPTEKPLVSRAEYTQYRVEFNGIKARVPAFMYVPNDGKKSHPAVLLQYGSGGSKKTNYIVAIGERFVKQGFVVLTIDIPNRGERRLGPRSLLEGNIFETMGDYSRAIDFLSQRADVDRERIAYMGISWGAITGIPFVAHDERVKVMASLVGGGNFMGWLPPNSVIPEIAEEVAKYDPYTHVGLIAPRPLLLLNVTKDALVPRFLGESLHKAATGAGVTKMWLETDHFFSTVNREDMADKVIEWVKAALR